MKATWFKMGIIVAMAASLSACAGMNATQRNTAIGAAAGAVAGNLIRDNAATTLGGAALGGVIGSQIQQNGGSLWQ